jgi:hypothetical protein
VKTPLLILSVLIASCLQAQNLAGIWKGRLGMSGGCFSENNLEIQLQVKGDSIWGSCYQYENINYYVKKNISGIYNRETKKLVLHEGIITTYHIHERCTICVKNFYLSFGKNGNVETLFGDWDGKVLGSGNDCSTGPIVLYRTKESAFREVPEIVVDTGTIRLDFYDNAEVDGDSITVLVDKNVVVSHQKLNTKAITTYITIDLNQTFHEVEMVAENLGSIPPNTAMLIVTAGGKRYQLFLTSTQSKSAMVRFVYDKKQDDPKTE